MMKRCLIALVITLLVSSIGRADQKLWNDFTELIVGDWTGHGAILAESDGGPLKRGDKFTLRGSYRTVANGKAILGTQTLTVVDHSERSFDCTVTFGWNPIDKTIEVNAYWSEGAVEQISLCDQKDDSFLGTYTILLPTGKKESADVVVKTSGNDKFAWTFASGPDAGKTLSSWQRIHKTAEGEKYLTFWKEYFQGEWDTTIVKGEESGVQETGTRGVWICQLHPAKNSMVFSATKNGVPNYNAVAGYDPKSGAWKEVFFMADGSHLIQFYRVPSDELDANSTGQVLKGRAEYIYSDGKIELAEIGVKVLSRNKCEYYVVDRRIDGQPQTDLLFAFERKKKHRAFGQRQPKISDEALSVLQYLEGTWQIEGRIGDDKASGRLSARWARGRHALITQDSLTVNGETVVSVGLIGWDPAKKQIGHLGFAADNDVFRNYWNVSVSGDWIGQVTGTREGKKFSAFFKVTKTSPDRFVFESKAPDGKETEAVYERIAPERGALGSRAQEVILPIKFTKQCEYYLGKWASEAEIEGAIYRGSWSVKWSPEKSCLVTHWVGDTPDGRSSATRIQGWDALTKKVLVVEFSPNGASSIERYEAISDEVDEGEITGVDAKGKPVKATARTVRRNRDFFTWTVTKDGNAVEFKFRRTKK